MYSWPAVMDEHGKIVLRAKEHKPQELLDHKRIDQTLVVPQDLLDPDWIDLKQVECYPDSNVNAGRRRGVAVIVNMVSYTGGDRSGGREDEAKLMKLIEDLQFEEKLLVDSKAGELQRQLKQIAATSIRAQDESFLCFVVAHGDSTIDGDHLIRDQDHDMIMLDDIIWPFRTCEHLVGKPKVFFVISSRGGNKPWAYPQPEFDVQHSTGWKEGTEIRYLHELTDCLMVFSTSAGSVSARYPGYGSTFVGALVTNFNPDKRQNMDVLGILNAVKMEVSAEEHETKDGQFSGNALWFRIP